MTRVGAGVVLAVAGVACAQTGSAAWLSDVVINDGGASATVTWSLSMKSSEPFTILSATIFDSLNVAGSEYGSVVSWHVLNNLDSIFGDETTTDGQSLFGTFAAQSTYIYGSDNPINVLEFSYEAEDGYSFVSEGKDVQFFTSSINVTLWAGDDVNSANAIDVTEFVIEGQASFGVVPSPGSAIVLVQGGAGIGLRRRRVA